MTVAEAIRAEPAARCAHCGLPVPGAESPPTAGEAAREEGAPLFCCSGCATVFGILREGGLDAYYRMEERRREPVAASGRAFEEFDHASYHDLYVAKRADGLLESDFYLEGVTCGSCVWLVERVPILVSGLTRAELDLRRSRVHVVWDGAGVKLSSIARTLDTLGYRPHPYRGLRLERARRDEERAALARIGVAGAIAVNTMLAALALYSGWLTGMEPAYERYFRWLSLLLVTPALFGPGRVFFRGAWAAVRTRSLHMDLPIAIALAAGYARGLHNTIRDAGPIYFDGVTLLIFLLLVGRFLQQRAQRAAGDAAELLHSLSPASARVVERPATRDVPVEALLPGMLVEVRAEETLPADGVVVEGRSALDLALLTGESRLVTVAAGAPVFAGTVNRGSLLRIRVDRAGEESRLGRILREAEAGARRRAPIVATADRLSGIFVLVVLALAAATLAIWWASSPTDAVDHAIALLIVTCPCALALATPLAVSVAIGRAARAGILVRGGAALEALARPGRIYLDKTGTVTEGTVSLLEWDGPDEAKRLVAALERHSSHPLARAFEKAWDAPGGESLGAEAKEVVYTAGGGLEGIVEGRRVVVGSPAFVTARLTRPDAERAAAAGTAPRGTPVLVAIDGAVVGRALFGDAIRDDALASLAWLRARGYDPHLLSGDDPGIVAAVGASLEFPADHCRGGAIPEEKLRVVEEAERRAPVVMVGDGVNDAAAIARAAVGVGVSGGAEACLASADVYLTRPGLEALVSLVEGSQRTLAVIRRNIVFSVAYNLVGAALAMTGLINPLIAAILMPASSMTVVLASWKSRTFATATGTRR
ncbi:MAG TPA: heavy metal translocating P-type ATPase [Candidatus Eisenbacteria bacterium]|nr:heavy metal translocating P-type ATPase [Candidatus Eisenbacteria bacterium]